MCVYSRWLFCLALLLPQLAPANSVSRYWPAQSTHSPHYWLALDGSESLTQLQQLYEWLPLSLTGERPYPANGLAIGLLAATPDAQGQFSPRVLFGPQPLLLEQTWPASKHYRHAALAGPTIIDTSSSTTATLYFQLPWLVQWQPVHFLQSTLSLSLSQPMAQGHDFELALVPVCEPLPQCGQAAQPLWQATGTVAIDGDTATLDLQVAMASWQSVQGQAWWRLTVQAPANPWQAWVPDQPAFWQFGWQQASHHSSGMSKLQHALESLLFTPFSQPILGGNSEALAAALTQAKAGLPPASELPMPSTALPAKACARNAAMYLKDLHEHYALSELSAWRDVHLAPLPKLNQLITRRFFGEFLGLDLAFQQAIPGQKKWPANLHFQPVGTSLLAVDPESAITNAGLVEAWQQFQTNGLWLSDVGQGMSLQATEQSFDWGVAAGTTIYYRASEFAQYLFWPDAIGRVKLVSAETGQVLWTWLPTRLAAHRQRVQQKLTTPYAAELSASDWLLWPSNEVAALHAQSRYLIGLIAGELLVLDITQALAPKLALQVHEGEWGSVSLISTTAQSPFLLLAAGPEKPQSTLQLYDLHRGELIWSADSQSHADLKGAWLSPWSSVTLIDGRVRSYGLDSLGQLWRLSTGANKLPRLEKIAQLQAIDITQQDANSLSLSVVLAGHAPLIASMTTSVNEQQQVLVFSDELAEDSQLELPLSNLPQWPTQSSSWRFELPTNEQIRQPIRWFQHQLIMVSGVQTQQEACAPMVEQTRIRRIPWRNNLSLTQPETIESTQALIGSPQINTEGELVFVGLTEDLKMSAVVEPMRIRLKRQLLRK